MNSENPRNLHEEAGYFTSFIFCADFVDWVAVNICSPVPEIFISVLLSDSMETISPSFGAKYVVPFDFVVPSTTISIP